MIAMLGTDNMRAVRLAEIPVVHINKHINIRHHFLREKMTNESLKKTDLYRRYVC